MAIRYLSSFHLRVVGKIETAAVLIKLLILVSFVVVGAYGLSDSPNIHQLLPQNWKSPLNMFSAGMVIFVAYEGFELIANAVPDVINPQKNVRKAFYFSIIFVILLYIIIAIVTVGSVSFAKIESVRDYALAEAARPGFRL